MMRRLFLAVLLPLLGVLWSCSVADSEAYTEREGVPAAAALAESSAGLWTEAAETEDFTVSQSANGGTVYTFRTNDASYLPAEGTGTVWKAADASGTMPVSATITKYAGNPLSGYGLVFCCRSTRTGDIYMLSVQINTHRQYKVVKYAAGETEVIRKWTYTDTLNAGYNAANALTVLYASSSREFTLVCNGPAADKRGNRFCSRAFRSRWTAGKVCRSKV